MRSRVYKTVRCPSVHPSVSQSVPSVKRSSAAARGRSTALSSKCGQCHVDSRINQAEQTWVTLYFRPIKILAVFTACVEFVSGWQHAWNYISTHWADWTLDGSTYKNLPYFVVENLATLISLQTAVFIVTATVICSLRHGLRLTAVPRSTQTCIPSRSLNRVPALAGVRAGMSPLPGGR